MRKVPLWRMLRDHKVDIVAVQEHHITSKLALQSQRLWAERRGYGLAAVLTPVRMRGGVLLMWRSPTWSLKAAENIGQRRIPAELTHASGVAACYSL